jgi:hypothetical protein
MAGAIAQQQCLCRTQCNCSAVLLVERGQWRDGVGDRWSLTGDVSKKPRSNMCRPGSAVDHWLFAAWRTRQRNADCPRLRSLCLAAGCEGSHDLVDTRFELGDRERFLQKRKWGRVLTHRPIIIDAPPLCIHRDLRPVSAAMEAGRNKARRPTH